MEHVEKKHNEKINNIIAIFKLASILLSEVIIFSEFLSKNVVASNNNIINFVVIGIFTSGIMLIYWNWIIFIDKVIKSKYKVLMKTIENFVFIFIFSIIIFLSPDHVAEYKFLFLFIIIISTLQLGMKQGMIIAILSSIIILGIDLASVQGNVRINQYFQSDLIIASIFILTAWPLGYYVENEKTNHDRKNLRIRELGNELKQNDKQRKNIEENLLKNEACYNLLIQNSRDSIFVHRDFKLIFVNESAIKLLGMNSHKELIGKSILDIIAIDVKDAVKEKFQQVYDEKTAMSFFEGKVVKSNGEVSPIKNTSTYFLYEGKPTILSIISDITSEKQVEELRVDVEKNIQLLNETREFNNYITDFFSNISHELKTPLNVIYSAIQVLSLHKSEDKEFMLRQDKYLKVVRQNCYRLIRLINNLLDLSKHDAGFLKLNLGTYNIVSVVEEITLSVVEYAKSKGIDIIFDTDIEEKIITFDPDKIERIILNLLSNAIKFNRDGGKILVNISDMNEKIAIYVEDTGLGIPDDKLEIIFERFRQVDKSLKRENEGSGIGLSLVKSFVEMHGGTVSIKTELDVGSSFVIYLPAILQKLEKFEGNLFYESNVERIDIEFSDIYYE